MVEGRSKIAESPRVPQLKLIIAGSKEAVKYSFRKKATYLFRYVKRNLTFAPFWVFVGFTCPFTWMLIKFRSFIVVPPTPILWTKSKVHLLHLGGIHFLEMQFDWKLACVQEIKFSIQLSKDLTNHKTSISHWKYYDHVFVIIKRNMFEWIIGKRDIWKKEFIASIKITESVI